ncbi:MAG TPA: AAA family ATPase [Actinospica sp.]|nr:AAA family ATPase [Actinospica sp.]
MSADPTTNGHGPGTRPADGAVASEDMPLWAIVLGWELRRGRQVLLHGEVNDRSWLWGAPATVKEVLCDYLEATGSEAVGWWDPVDGLSFPLPGHAERFARLRVAAPAATGTDQDSDPQDAVETDAEPDADPSPTGRHGAVRRARRGLLAPGDPSAAALPADLGSVIDLARAMAARPEASVAFVFQDLDVALPAADPASAPVYLRLRAAMREAVTPLAAQGRPPHRRNPVLVVTGDPRRLPDWFEAEDPRLVALRVARPDQAERRLWLSLLGQNFHGAVPGDRLESLVGPTDGFTAWDLEALARTSVIREVPVAKPARLLDALRINVRTDPWERLDAETVAGSAQRLARDVIGQPRAVAAVADALQTAYTGVDFGSSGAARPRGVFFFVGPTGVGKTELAKSVARLLFGDETAYARFDMSEYREEHAAERLAGAPPGFTGYEQGGELTRRVQERPFSVLLFDEIEKANPAVLDKFLQILEDGRLTDGRGQTAYFSQSLIIFTSNTGADTVRDLSWDGPDGPTYQQLEEHFLRAVEQRFEEIKRPEIYGRLRPGVVVFDLLRDQHVAAITDRMLDLLAESVLERQRLVLEPDRQAIHGWMRARMRQPDNARYGGRQIRNELETLRTALVRHLVRERPAPGDRLSLSVRVDGEVRIGTSPRAITGPAGTTTPETERR